MLNSGVQEAFYYTSMKNIVALKTVVVSIVLLMTIPVEISAQEEAKKRMDWYFGVGTGFHYSTLRFSNLDSKKFPTKKGMFSPVYSLFVQGEFGQNRNFVFRPQISFLSRGGKLTEIGKYDGYANSQKTDEFYQLKSKYVDFKIPLLYQFGTTSNVLRPYAGISAIFGFATGGYARLQEDFNDNSYSGYEVKLSGKNFKSTYFALAPTIGLRYNFHTGRKAQHILFAAIELSYEFGLSDTYSSDEKSGKSIDVVRKTGTKIDGTRKFSGWDFQVTLGIPFSIFSRSVEPVKEMAPVREIESVSIVTEKTCYTLEEIMGMIALNKNVYGKTICAVDDINFEFGESEIKKESYNYLNKIAQIINRTNSKVIIKGHTDNVGTDDYNMNLSRERAQAVMKYLIRNGVEKNRITCEYWGSSMPLMSNDTEEGRKYNRRVEFELLK